MRRAGRKPTPLQMLLLALPLLLATWAVLAYFNLSGGAAPAVIRQMQQEVKPVQQVIPEITYPQGELLLDSARGDYTEGELRLVVPRLNLDCSVMDGVDPDTLQRGVGLYDNAQLPSMGNPNVSIAGHRDIYGSPFMDIDKLTEGDRLYLVYGDSVYRYDWQQTITVQPDDWSVIHCTDYSRITLTSCDPVGTTLRRIIAIGKLAKVDTYTADYRFE